MCPCSMFPEHQLNSLICQTSECLPTRCLFITKGKLKSLLCSNLAGTTFTKWAKFTSPETKGFNTTVPPDRMLWEGHNILIWRDPTISSTPLQWALGPSFLCNCLFLEKSIWIPMLLSHSWDSCSSGNWNTFNLADFINNHHKIELCSCKRISHSTWGKNSINNKIM